MSKSFILNDESVKNSHGFYLHNSGGRWERFDANPVMLDNHNMDRLAGKWLNRRIEGSQIIADPDFDIGSPIGAERKGQVDRGYLNGASLGIEILRAELVGDDLFVTEWETFEASVTPIPSNAGSLQLKIYDHNGNAVEETKIKAHISNIVKLSAEQSNKTIIPKIMDKIQLTAQATTTLGLVESSDSAAISAAIVNLAAERDKLKEQLDAHTRKVAVDMVELAIKEGKITADRRDAFVKLALADYQTAKDSLDGIPAKETLSGKINPIQTKGGVPADRKGWTLLRWMREDGAELNRIRSEEPDTYELIKKVR